MKRILLFTVASILMLGSVIGQTEYSETRKTETFDEVLFGISGDVYITIGPEFSVILEGDSDVLREIKTEVKGSRLHIYKGTKNWRMREHVKVMITMPAVKGLSLTGSGNIKSLSDLEGGSIYLVVSGSGNITLNSINYDDLDCVISGSGSVRIAGDGSNSNAVVKISGSGGYYAEALESATASIVISGSGSCKCFVSEQLKATVSGSGSIVYGGSPKIDSRTSGSGRVRSR